MPAPQQQQSSSTSDNSMDFLWGIALVVVGVALIWYFGRSYIVSFIFQLRLIEIMLIDYVLMGWTHIANIFHLPVPDTSDLVQTVATINSSTPAKVELSEVVNISNTVGRYFSFPVASLIAIFGIISYFVNVGSRFRTKFTMDQLRKAEVKNWPMIEPVTKVNLVKQDLDEGPWAMALTPVQFAKKNNLLQEKSNGRVTVTLIEGAAYRTFALQVGQFWRDPMKLPIHTQALLAIFLARANRDRTTSDKLLNQIGESSASNRLNFSGVREVLQKYKNSKVLQQITKRHAYIFTVMATMLELARTDGVLGSAEFLWLKPVDRTLWYMLNTVGRQTAVPEVAGAYGHWLAEKKAGRALMVPMVDEAVKALEVAIKEVIYEPDEE